MLREVLAEIDQETLLLVLALVHLGNLLFSLLFFSGKKGFPGTSSWIGGQALLVLASALLPWLGRSFGPHLLLALPNTLYYLASLCLLNAVWHLRFARAMPRPLWATAVIFCAGFTALALGQATVNLRVVYYSAWMGALSLASGLILVRGMDRRLRMPALLAASTFIVAFPFHLFRALHALASPDWPSLIGQDPGLSAFNLVSIFSAYLLLLAFVLLASMRSTLELRDLNETQLVMLQVIAHDLRNPIGGAARYVRKHLVPEGVDLQAKRESIRILGRTLAETDDLLENLLMWANDKMGVAGTAGADGADRPEDIDLDALLEPILGLLGEVAREKGIGLEVEGRGLHLFAARNGSAVVLRNILSNAIKFTPPHGLVTVRSRLSAGGIEVAIGDTGIGMDAARLGAFRAGREVQSTPGTAGERGSGLGLALCKRFMEGQGGSISVESREGGGSTFTLVFPPAQLSAR